MAKMAIGEFLVDEGIITQNQLALAIEEQKKNGKRLGEVIVGQGLLTEESLSQLVAMHHGVRYVDLNIIEPQPEALKVLSRDMVKKYQVLPFYKHDGIVSVIVADPMDANLINITDHLKHGIGLNVEFCMSPIHQIKQAMEKYYHVTASLEAVDTSVLLAEQEKDQSNPLEDASLQEVTEDLAVQSTEDILSDMEVVEEQEEDDGTEGGASAAPVIRLVDTVIHNAIAMKASDIHIEPYEKTFAVRYRLDGSLQEMKGIPPVLKRAVAARIKVMAKLNIVERRKPQDGKIRVRFGKRFIDLRVSTLPIVYGEKIVLRILDSSVTNLDLNTLGFEPEDQEKFEKAIRSAYGMVLVTGPTGSGKTRTLYTALNTINARTKNIMTAEDPVEFQIKGINQCSINDDVGLTFSAVLKAALRQDPNIILVGEIRDIETGSTAIKAAMTGHLVLSTLHTNDAPSTVTRLVDMGIDNIQVGISVVCVVAQRLVRLICQNCKTEEPVDMIKLKNAGIDPKELEGVKLYQAKGCDQCNRHGIKGREAIYEVMPMVESIRKAIYLKQDVSVVRQMAVASGMRTLRDAAMLKLKNGKITIDEVMRVTLAE